MAEAAVAAARPVAEELFFSLEPPLLAGSRCLQCATVVFPAATACPCCSSEDVARIALAGAGTLWSWTVQHVEPKKPYLSPAEGFQPFGVGYVDLGEVLVETRLIGAPGGFRIGQRVSLVLLPLPPAAGESEPVVTFAFSPQAQAS